MASTRRMTPKKAICFPGGIFRVILSSSFSATTVTLKALTPMLDTMSVPNGKTVSVTWVDTEPSSLGCPGVQAGSKPLASYTGTTVSSLKLTLFLEGELLMNQTVTPTITTRLNVVMKWMFMAIVLVFFFFIICSQLFISPYLVITTKYSRKAIWYRYL